MNMRFSPALQVRAGLLASVGVAAVAFGSPAFAQTPVNPAETDCADTDNNGVCDLDEAEGTVETGPLANTIVVTGSRISRPNLEGVTPITTITADELLDTGDLAVGDSLNELPALRSTFSQANSTGSIGTVGLNLLDLRGLGTARTLTLVNGRRHVSSTPGDYRVDINTIPSVLIDRVDIVTGGNSAIYGSDAVSGVVNFVLKDDYEGIQVTGQGGISDRGDRGSYRVSAIAGTNLLDDRLNVTIAGEYSRQKQVLNTQRADQLGTFDGAPGFITVDNTLGEPPEGDGIPDTAFAQVGTKFNIIAGGGVVLTSCPAPTATNAARVAAVCTGATSPTGGRLSNNYFFLPDGTLVRNNPTFDLRNIGGGIIGGRGFTGIEGGQLIPGIERYVVNALVNLDISPMFNPYLEAKYVNITANQRSGQPTFVNSILSPVFSIDNPFLTTQARNTINTITGGTSTFTFFRFNNDIGTRAEDHKRETYRIVGGVRGDLNDAGTLNYDVAVNFGRTDTFYTTGGNVDLAKFNNASDAVRAADGSIQCRINTDASTTNNDPNCVPINLFGYGAPSQAAQDYVLYESSRDEWAEQLQIVGFLAGDTSGFFNLPGGPLGFAVGAEYRTEDAFSDYDDFTAATPRQTFLNSFATFDPPKVDVKEAFAEIRIPLLADRPFFNELTIEAAGRVSDYSFLDDEVYAYNVGAIYSPFDSLSFRAGYARSVRAPNLSNLYAARTETFANNLQDPCDQRFINENPNRARNCAADGIPTTITLPGETTPRPFTNQPSSGISGFNQGNPDLEPEVGKSFTAGAVFQPNFLPGFALTVDYYDIEITEAISGLTGQAILNRCYDDPVGIDNPFCAAIFRRTSTDPIANATFDGQLGRRFDGFPDFALPQLGPGFLNQPFNFQRLETSGVDVNASYRGDLGSTRFATSLLVSYLIDRNFYTFITDPDRYVRAKSTLGDPEWGANFSMDLDFGDFDIGYDLRYVGKMTIGTYETQFSVQGRPPENADAFPFPYYGEEFYHDIQVGFDISNEYRFFTGVDNVTDNLPPLGLTGTGDGSAIYDNVGRYFYAGVRARF